MAEEEKTAEDESEVLLEIERSPGSGEKIFVQKSTFKGREFIDIRIFYDASKTDEEEWRPTKKGVAIPPELIPQIIEALQKGI
jgi:hypothetical protein